MASSSLLNHWSDMPEWRPGRRLWALYLTFADQPDLHAAAVDYQRELADLPGVDLIDVPWLHLTMQGIAFTDELGDRVGRVCAQLREAFTGWRLPVLEAHPPVLDRDAIALPVTPAAEMHELKRAIETTAAQVVGGEPYRLPEPQGGFSPHISIAYGNREVPGELIWPRLARVRHPRLLLRVKHLSLIELRRDVPRWYWETEQRIPLSRMPAHAIAARTSSQTRSTVSVPIAPQSGRHRTSSRAAPASGARPGGAASA